MAEESRNVFISHIHEDDEGLKRFKDLLQRKDFQIRDSSISSGTPNDASNEDYIKGDILAPRIQWAGTLVVYISPETRESPWVDWEIKYAHRLGKRIVGIWAHGENECDVPDALDQFADAVVGWDGNRIVDAITGEINDWTSPSGEPRTPRAIARYSCR